MRKVRLFLLISAFLLTAIRAGASSIDDFLMVSLHTYLDDTHQVIYSTRAALTKRLSDRWGYGISLGVDAISGATPSTSSNGGGGDDDDEEEGEDETGTRVYPSFSLKYDDGDQIAAAGGYVSIESDYSGRSFFLDYTRLFNLGNTAAGVSLSQSADKWEIGDVDPDNRDERSVTVSITQTLSPRAQARIVWTGFHSEGYLSNPYRHIDIGATRVLERLPEQRNGDALAVKLVTLLSEATSLHVGYRYYSDDWSLSSNTVDTALYRDTSDRWTWGGRLRYYTQTDAEFIRPLSQIQITDELVAIDHKNTAFDTYTAGVEFHYKPGGRAARFFDWDKARFKGGLDLYRTSSNAFIDNWYGQDSITGAIVTVSLEYAY